MKKLNQCVLVIQILGITRQIELWENESQYTHDIGLVDKKIYDDEQEINPSLDNVNDLYFNDENTLSSFLSLGDTNLGSTKATAAKPKSEVKTTKGSTKSATKKTQNSSTKIATKSKKSSVEKSKTNSSQVNNSAQNSTKTKKSSSEKPAKNKPPKVNKQLKEKRKYNDKKNIVKKKVKILTFKEEQALMKKKYGIITSDVYESLSIPNHIQCTSRSVAFLTCWHRNWNQSPLKKNWNTSRYYCAIWGIKRGMCIHITSKGEFIPDKDSLLGLIDKQDWSRNANLFCTTPIKGKYICTNYRFRKYNKCKETQLYGQAKVNKCGEALSYDVTNFSCNPQEGEFVNCLDKNKVTTRICYKVAYNLKYWRCNTYLLSKFHKGKKLFVVYRSFFRNPTDQIFPGWA